MFLHGFMSFAAVGIIVACLIIMGSFTLLTLNIDDLLISVQNDSEITARIDESLTDAEARSIGSKINAIPNVRDCEFIPREKALEDFIQGSSQNAELLRGLEQDNPLRNSYRIFLEDAQVMTETAKEIEEIAGVAVVSANYDIVLGIMKVREIVRLVSYIITAILLVISVFIISNTVKLATFDRRDEIAIMKMVGATNGFIRWPFLFEGLILGVFGSVIAYFAQWGLYRAAGTHITDFTQMVQVIPFDSISREMLAAFLAVGFIVGVGGSLLTIRKFMRV